ncbi:MAG: DUF4268 domain-containing protein [Candidatus Izemoplasmatales bacterium]|nr:DUF4268 domain-containing protein [Candidatus Izemoplasmatales bacterium]
MILGKIHKLNLRDIWKHEALDFSQWLAKPENIQYLNETIGLSLVDIQTERNVGGFKCDIVCRDEFTERIVIIENQLESSNHDHLGKIITYASGLDASVIIWIVKNAREEHASAIEWLNAHTDSSISFFLIQIEIIQIGDSSPAPQFRMIEEPNEYNKNMKRTIRENRNSESDINKFEFWTIFNEVLNEGGDFNVRKASVDHWYDFTIGTSKCYLVSELFNKDKRIRISMYIPDDKELFSVFYLNKEAIERSIGVELVWEIQDSKKSCRIFSYINDFSFSKPEKYIELSNSMIDLLSKYRMAFKPYISSNPNRLDL